MYWWCTRIIILIFLAWFTSATCPCSIWCEARYRVDESWGESIPEPQRALISSVVYFVTADYSTEVRLTGRGKHERSQLSTVLSTCRTSKPDVSCVRTSDPLSHGPIGCGANMAPAVEWYALKLTHWVMKDLHGKFHSFMYFNNWQLPCNTHM